MNYEIIWQPDAFERMSTIVGAAPSRKDEFAAVLRELTAALTANPEQAGESREPPFRVVIIDEMTFYFQVLPDNEQVAVVWVRIWKARH